MDSRRHKFTRLLLIKPSQSHVDIHMGHYEFELGLMSQGEALLPLSLPLQKISSAGSGRGHVELLSESESGQVHLI